MDLNKHPLHVDTVDWHLWKPEERAVLCYIFADNQVLLIHKKKGLGAGKINAPGGRIEPGETPLEAAVRETIEETGITPLNPVQSADVSFIFLSGYSLHGAVFTASAWEGTLTETDEALPFWCPVPEIPYADMWEDDILWLPHVIAGKYTSGRFIFDEDNMLSYAMDITGPIG